MNETSVLMSLFDHLLATKPATVGPQPLPNLTPQQQRRKKEAEYRENARAMMARKRAKANYKPSSPYLTLDDLAYMLEQPAPAASPYDMPLAMQ